MRLTRPLAVVLVAASSCVGGDDPTSVGDGPAQIALQPALIPSPANASALPINRIRTVTVRAADGVVLRDQQFEVSPTAPSWAIEVGVPAGRDPIEVIVYLQLLNVSEIGVEAVQFSGRTPPTLVSGGQRLTGVDADIVRGPLANLAVTDVQITAFPATLLVGASGALSATVTASGNATATLFWSSLDTGVATLVDSVATGVAAGTARIVASAGAHTDTVSVVVVSPVDSVRVSPDSADVTVGATFTYTAELRDIGGAILTGRPITWTTGNTSIATVTSAGVVTGVAPGTTTVRATSEGVFDVAIVRVVALTAGPLITWTRSGSGNWSDGTAWSLGRAPQAGDTVRLTQGDDYTVTLDVNASVAALRIGGTTDVIGLDVGDRTLAITGSFAGPELDILPFGRIDVDDGIVNVRGVAIAGTLRSTGAAWVHADSIWHSGTWAAASGVQQVGPITPAWISIGGTIDLGTGAILQFGPGSVVEYGSTPSVIQGTGLLWLYPGSMLRLHTDLMVDGPNLTLQSTRIIEEDSEDVIVGANSSLTLSSSTTIPAESESRFLVDGSLAVQGPRTTIRSVEVRAGGTFIVQDGGSPAVIRTGGIDNRGDMAFFGSTSLTFGPGDTGQIHNYPEGVIDVVGGGSYVLDGELVNDGAMYVAGATQLVRTDGLGNAVTAQHVNTGLLSLAAGNLHVVLAGPSPSSITNAGAIHLEPSTTLSVENATSPASQIISTSTAILDGEGTVDVRTGVPTGINNGTLSPGSSPGVLTWLGSIPMGPTGAITVELEGTAPGTGYDRLAVSADLLLNLGTGGAPSGNLVVTSPGFVPPDGSRYAILTFRERFGNFANVTLPLVANVTFDTLWTANAGATPDTLYIVTSGGPVADIGGDWTFDEGSGQTAFDVLGPGNHGQLGTTSGVDSDDPSWIQGRVAGALAFDGTRAVLVPEDAALEPATLTVEAFVRATAPGQYAYIVSKGGGPSAGVNAEYGLYTGGSFGLQFYVSQAGPAYVSDDAGTSVWDGSWHHVAGTFDGSSVRLYVDGAEVGTANAASLAYYTTGARDLAIGKLNVGQSAYGFNGDIDEVRVWRRALSQSEIAARAARSTPGNLNRWVTGTDGSWGTAANWSKGTVPAPGDSVVIDASGFYTVTLSGGATVGALTVGRSGSSPTLALSGPGHTLTVAGRVTNEGVISFLDNASNATPMVLDAQGGFVNLPGGIVVTQQGTGIDFARLSGDIDNQGTIWTQAGGLIVPAVPASHVNTGLIYAAGGNIIVQLSGTDEFVNGASLVTEVSRQIQFQGGSLRSTGLIAGQGTLLLSGTAFTNDAAILPGFGSGTGTGILTISGDQTWGPSGLLALDMGGSTPGAHDQLAGDGVVSFDGTLLVTLSSFTPQVGERYAVMTFGSRAAGTTFADVQLPFVPGIALDTLWAEAGPQDTLYIVATASATIPLGAVIGPSGTNADDVDGSGNAVNLVGTASNTGTTTLAATALSPPTFDFNTFGGVDRTSGFDRSDLLAVRADMKHDSTALVLDLDNDGNFVGESPQPGIGMHANRFVTFDLAVIRSNAQLPVDQAFILSGIAGPADYLTSSGMALAVLLDGIPVVMHDVPASATTSVPFFVAVDGNARHLTFVTLDGSGPPPEPFGDHGGFAQVLLSLP